MSGPFPNPEVMVSHTIPRPQQPQEEAQRLAPITKISNPEHVAK